MRKFNFLFMLVWVGLLMMQVKASDRDIHKIGDAKETNNPTVNAKMAENIILDEKEQKMKRFFGWVLESISINNRFFPRHITKIIFSYLVFNPATSKLRWHEKGKLEKGAISRNGQWFLSTYFDEKCNLFLWDLSSGDIIQTFIASLEYGTFNTFAISDNNEFVIAAVDSLQHIYLWKRESGELMARLVVDESGDEHRLSCGFFLNDTRIFASQSTSYTVLVWAVEGTRWTRQLVLNHTDRLYHCIATKDNTRRIVSITDNKQFLVWNGITGACEHELNYTGYIGPLWEYDSSTIIISVDNKLIGMVNSSCEEIKLWDIITGEWIKTIPNLSEDDDFRMKKIAYLSSERIVWWDQSGVYVWNLRTDTVAYTLLVEARFVSVSADGKYLIIVHVDGEPLMQVYSFETGISDQVREKRCFLKKDHSDQQPQCTNI